MGFLTRLLPRSVRRAMHPGRAGERAVTPKVVKKARRAFHPIGRAKGSARRSMATSLRSGRKKRKAPVTPVYMHGKCPVRHRTAEAAARCRNR